MMRLILISLRSQHARTAFVARFMVGCEPIVIDTYMMKLVQKFMSTFTYKDTTRLIIVKYA